MRLKLFPVALALFFLLPLASCATTSSENEIAEIRQWPERPDFSAENAADAAVRRFPASVTMHRFAVRNAIDGGRHSEAVVLAKKIVAFGDTLSDAAFAYLSGHMGEAELAELKRQSGSNAVASERSTVLETIPSDVKLAEALALADDGIFVSSVVSGGIYLAKGGSVSEWSVHDAEARPSHLGIVLDEARGILWAATAKVDPSPVQEGHFVGLIGYDLDTGREVRRIASPEAENSSPGDIFLSPEGKLYLADSGNGAIYTCADNCTWLSTFLTPEILRSPQGMVLSNDGSALIVSDYSYGLAHIDLDSRKVSQIAAPDTIALDGIDGLYAYGHYLIAVQNGRSPARISAFRIGRQGTRISCVRILENAHPEWEEPTNGQVAGDTFFYNAGAQWPKFAKAAAVIDGETLNPTQIRSLDLRFPEAECR